MSALPNRRALLFAFAGVVLPSAARGQGDAESAVLVRALYEREIARHNARQRVGEAEFLAPFARDTQAVWRKARDDKRPTHDPAGPILNAFFGWGVLPGHEVTLAGVAQPAELFVAVRLAVRGRTRTATVQLVREAGALRIADIAYESGESFLAYNRRRAGTK